jgi:hypothetical protein
VIKAHRLHRFLVNPSICAKFHTIDDWENTWISEEYLKWEQQDQLLLSWLQSTILREIVTQVSGFASTRGNWVKKFRCIFTRTPSRRLITHQHEVSSASLWISRHYCGKSFCLLISTSNSNINWSTIWFFSGIFDPITKGEVETLILGHKAQLEGTLSQTDNCFN